MILKQRKQYDQFSDDSPSELNKDQSTGKDSVSTSNHVIEDAAKDEKEIKARVQFF